MTEQSEYLTRLVFENSSLTSLVNILYSKQNIKKAAAIELSLAKNKTVNFLNTDFLKNSLIQQNLIKFIYETYQSTYGNLDNKIKLSNRLKYLRSFEYDKYIRSITQEVYKSKNINPLNLEPLKNKPDKLTYFLSPIPILKPFNSETSTPNIVYKDSYIIKDLDNLTYKNIAVYDLTSQTKVPSNRRIKITKQDNYYTVGVAYDPFVYKNSFIGFKRESLEFNSSLYEDINTELSDNEIEFLQKSQQAQQLYLDGEVNLNNAIDNLSIEEQKIRLDLIERELITESDFLLAPPVDAEEAQDPNKKDNNFPKITRISVVLDQKKGNDLLNLINGRTNEIGFGLYIKNKLENDLLEPTKGGLYILKKSKYNEFALPVFNFNITPGQKERLIFEQTARDSFNYNNLYLYNK